MSRDRTRAEIAADVPGAFHGLERAYDESALKVRAEVKQKGHIERALNELMRMIELSHESLGDLHTRLHPVLNETSADGAGKEASGTTNMSPLASSIDEAIGRIASLNRRINYIKEVIDL